ncbi:MAG TPA: NAD(P)/FAD-dependent oxidoreductase [Candidatus Bathyarchaeia archaeon]|nr:NAD(P)/FAD-dependent oxidoreductase [Candidatus Bathyarchaeia archaeon]
MGAGPVGLYAAYYAGFRGLTTTVVESLPIIGGQISAFYADDMIYDVPGFPAITGRELVARLAEQAARFPYELRLGTEVRAIRRENDAFRLTTVATADPQATGEQVLTARTVLLTAGIGSFEPLRVHEPAISGFEGRGLAYYPPPPEGLRSKRVLVVGGGERAVATALEVAPHAASVTLIHRRDRLQIDTPTRARLDASPVRFLPFREIERLDGSERVERAALLDRKTGTQESLAVEVVVLCYGFHARAETMGRFGVALEGDAVLVDSRMAASVAGVYAAGDGATYPGKVRVLAADFGEACTAVNNIAATVVPGAHVFPGYSSHRRGAARRDSGPRQGS